MAVKRQKPILYLSSSALGSLCKRGPSSEFAEDSRPFVDIGSAVDEDRVLRRGPDQVAPKG